MKEGVLVTSFVAASGADIGSNRQASRRDDFGF
jgi:hypothetical protein